MNVVVYFNRSKDRIYVVAFDISLLGSANTSPSFTEYNQGYDSRRPHSRGVYGSKRVHDVPPLSLAAQMQHRCISLAPCPWKKIRLETAVEVSRRVRLLPG